MKRRLLVVKVGGSLLDWTPLPHFLREWTQHCLTVQQTVVLIGGGGRWADEVRAADQRFGLGQRTAHRLAVQSMCLTSKLLLELLPAAEWLDDLSLFRFRARASETTVGPGQASGEDARRRGTTDHEAVSKEAGDEAAVREKALGNEPSESTRVLTTADADRWSAESRQNDSLASLAGEKVTAQTATDAARAPGRLIVLDCARFLAQIEPRVPGTCLPETWDVTSDSIAARVAVASGASELRLLKSIDIPTGTDVATAAARGWVDPFFPQAVAGLAKVTWLNPRTNRDGELVVNRLSVATD